MTIPALRLHFVLLAVLSLYGTEAYISSGPSVLVSRPVASSVRLWASKADLAPGPDKERTPTNKEASWGLPAPMLASVAAALMLLGEPNLALGANNVDPAGSSPPQQQSTSVGRRYWNILSDPSNSAADKQAANEALVDYTVGTIETMYYDNSGGAYFNSREFYNRWKDLKRVSHPAEVQDTRDLHRLELLKRKDMPSVDLSTRDGVVTSLKWIVNSLHDPYSKYLTRDELWKELHEDSGGFLGLGAMVETPKDSGVPSLPTTMAFGRTTKFLTTTRVANLPVVTAVVPNSPAERAGLVVGDRIVAVGNHNFLGFTRSDVAKTLTKHYQADNYLGHAALTVAKPIYGVADWNPAEHSSSQVLVGQDDSPLHDRAAAREVVLGYRQVHVKLPTKASEAESPYYPPSQTTLAGGDKIVHYELLTPLSGSIFERSKVSSVANPQDLNELSTDSSQLQKIGYIRLTRFSKASTAGFVSAIQHLEAAGAQAYILDLRNNYGGVIQEAMLTASTLLRDSHSVLCYTLNSRGGFTPHDVEEFAVDQRYPGYLLSKEASTVTIDQVRREAPEMFEENGIAWTPPSSFASLHEQTQKRGIRTRVSELSRDVVHSQDGSSKDWVDIGGEGNPDWNVHGLREYLSHHIEPSLLAQLKAQKKIVLLINEGTASSAEVFASALHDNGRVAALVGTKTFGKGLIQHTFPLPDGGGLRLTVAEYLTPSLQHVTKVGGAQFDRTGTFVGGGIQPDVVCDSKTGIPGNIRADFCVGLALDVLEDAEQQDEEETSAGDAPLNSQLVASAISNPSLLLNTLIQQISLLLNLP